MNKQFTRMQKLAGVLTEGYDAHSESITEANFHSNIDSAWDTEEKIIADLKKFMSMALEIGGEDLVAKIKSAVNSSMTEEEQEVESTSTTSLPEGKMTKKSFKEKIKEAILAERSLSEAKKKKEEEPAEDGDVDIESDVEGDVDNLDLDITGGEGGEQIDMNMDTEGDIDAGSSESKKAFSELTDAYRAAKELGDEKLIRQIANTITYFNKNIILKQG